MHVVLKGPGLDAVRQFRPELARQVEVWDALAAKSAGMARTHRVVKAFADRLNCLSAALAHLSCQGEENALAVKRCGLVLTEIERLLGLMLRVIPQVTKPEATKFRADLMGPLEALRSQLQEVNENDR